MGRLSDQTIPTRVRCGGITYRVKMVTPRQMAEMMVEGDSPLGAVCWDDETIYIRDDLSPTRTFIVFCHELAHVLADTAGYGDDMGEQIAQRLERPLASMFADNGWLP